VSLPAIGGARYENRMEPAVYIPTNKHRTVFYKGVTSNLPRRIHEHKQKLIGGFTCKYNINLLVFYEFFDLMTVAIELEKRIKKKSRRGKIRLIEGKNPDWKDLSPRREKGCPGLCPGHDLRLNFVLGIWLAFVFF
jgi:putative endonuclease